MERSGSRHTRRIGRSDARARSRQPPAGRRRLRAPLRCCAAAALPPPQLDPLLNTTPPPPSLLSNPNQMNRTKNSYTRRNVGFPCAGVRCEAWFYRPKKPFGGGRPPVVIIGHGARRERAPPARRERASRAAAACIWRLGRLALARAQRRQTGARAQSGHGALHTPPPTTLSNQNHLITTYIYNHRHGRPARHRPPQVLGVLRRRRTGGLHV